MLGTGRAGAPAPTGGALESVRRRAFGPGPGDPIGVSGAIGGGGSPMAVSRIDDPGIAVAVTGVGDAGARRPDAFGACGTLGTTGTTPADVTMTPGCAEAGCAAPDCAVAGLGGGVVVPVLRGAVTGGGCVVLAARGGRRTPVAGALRARRGGSGGRRRPHDWHTASSSAFSALQNGQNLMLPARLLAVVHDLAVDNRVVDVEVEQAFVG
jgi:hypothetical protein